MPRANKTFSSKDLIRYFVKNLTPEEQEDVRCFFVLAELSGRKTKKGFELITKFIIQLFKATPAAFLLDIIDDLISISDEPVDVRACLKRLGRSE